MVIFLAQLHHFKLSHKGATHKLFLHVISDVKYFYMCYN
jgi:hypothetical protein